MRRPLTRTIVTALLTAAVAVVLAACTATPATTTGGGGHSSAAIPTGVTGAADFDKGALVVGDGKTTVDTYIDPMCPYCGQFERANGVAEPGDAQLGQGARQGVENLDRSGRPIVVHGAELHG